MKRFEWIAGVLYIFANPENIVPVGEPNYWGISLQYWLSIDDFNAIKPTCPETAPALLVVVEGVATDMAYECFESIVHAGGECQLVLKPVPICVPKLPIIDGRDPKYLTLKSVIAEMESKSEKGLVAAWQIKEWVTKLKASI